MDKSRRDLIGATLGAIAGGVGLNAAKAQPQRAIDGQELIRGLDKMLPQDIYPTPTRGAEESPVRRAQYQARQKLVEPWRQRQEEMHSLQRLADNYRYHRGVRLSLSGLRSVQPWALNMIEIDTTELEAHQNTQKLRELQQHINRIMQSPLDDARDEISSAINNLAAELLKAIES